MNKYIAECIGTFALVFCGTGAVIVNEQTQGQLGNAGIAITFGLVVMAMIYTFGDTSGAHFNPAVTVGFTLAKRFNKKLMIPYILSQLAGACGASLALKYLFIENKKLGATIPAGTNTQSFILEFILSFLLMLVILNVSQGAKEKGVLAGIAIGATILLEAMFAGPVSGASMNPARSLAPAIVSENMHTLWIYLIAPPTGMITGSFTWRMMNKK